MHSYLLIFRIQKDWHVYPCITPLAEGLTTKLHWNMADSWDSVIQFFQEESTDYILYVWLSIIQYYSTNILYRQCKRLVYSNCGTSTQWFHTLPRFPICAKLQLMDSIRQHHGLLGCDAMWSCSWLPVFRRNVGNYKLSQPTNQDLHLQCHKNLKSS
jgi:hypothetical protein